MSKKFYLIVFVLILGSTRMFYGASVGADGGISLLLSYSGNLVTDMVVNDAGDPVNDSSGNQWQAKNKLEHDLQLFTQHVYQMTEGKHYIRQVLVIDLGRAWENADIRWDMTDGVSSASINGWDNINSHINMRSSFRNHIHEVISHEFGHYFYGLSDEYSNSTGYYQGYFSGTGNFIVEVDPGCLNTIMENNSPYQFCDANDHSLTITYDHPTSGNNIIEDLTPAVIDDNDPDNDGPINYWIDQLFALDGWSVAEINQADLVGHHVDGVRPAVDFTKMPEMGIFYVEQEAAAPGRILLLDRSGSMNHQEYGIPASQYVQEAGLYLYHSSESTDHIGALVYNDQVTELFAYDLYNDMNNLINFYPAQGLTDICKVIKTALDTLEAEHGDNMVAGGELYLMSDGKQTTGNNLWNQVDRANNLGVRIHTFSYGAADQAVMEQIASDTNAEDFLMSENTSGLMNLKMSVIRSLSKIRGWTPVYDFNGKLSVSGETDKGIQVHNLDFDVPPNCKNIRFYVFPALPTLNLYSFSMLNDATGNQVLSESNLIQNQGRFVGKKVNFPDAGKWSVTIYGGQKIKTLPQGNVQILAYVDNKNIQADIWMTRKIIDISAGYPQILIYGSVSNKYVLTKVATNAVVYEPTGRRLFDIEMYDNGKNGDKIAEDGIYTAVLDTKKIAEVSKFLKIALSAMFRVTEESIPAPNIEYEYEEDYQRILDTYDPAVFESFSWMMFGLTPKIFSPSINVKRFIRKIVQCGSKYKDEIEIINAYPDPDNIRVNLGPGIKITRVKGNRSSGRYVIYYSVARDAEMGKRDLFIQFDSMKFKYENVLMVSEQKKSFFRKLIFWKNRLF